MFVRRKKNKSGSTSVQIIDTTGAKDRLVKTIGSSTDNFEIDNLCKKGQLFIDRYHGQQKLNLPYDEDQHFFSSLTDGIQHIQMVGPELILGKLFDEIGFNNIPDSLFRHLVISRLVFPLSKLKTSEYLLRYHHISVDISQIYRYLDKLVNKQKEEIQRISYEHTLKLFDGKLSVVFYDVTTLYFEASDEDDLRKTGFSKDGKHQNPQIVLGLLVSLEGYPLAFDIFEGNKFEGHTMLPVVEAFKVKFKLDQLMIIADAGLLSKSNVEQLLDNNYEFILGGKIKTESNKIKKLVLDHKFKEGESLIIQRDEHTRLIVNYSSARAKKDMHNRIRGLNKLEKSVSSGKLSKTHINNRGYNKYLKMDGEIDISIDYDKFKGDGRWDGLKGYVTNSRLKEVEIIENYKHLWQIEKAFRISKTDLRIRPIYHRLPARISAHLVIAFASYKLYKELERQLKEKNTNLTVEKAIDLMKTIFKITIQLPLSKNNKEIIFAAEQAQKELLAIFQVKPILD
ncbi:IS1634 family transposase [Pedobacter sp. MC2016-05]|uniref:IS1634 family transposase n=1 Tax=Pedobacter sp. MC2016-05 TaxID=2994474 RepID=UPI0022486D45|nr:IS1634 family transposase [Pedobacter sp. MC2016-05]MCX2474238.1 IS1634 family transposase [Pedobacter sp. MC2016-05]